jgi:hypothetical protein
MMAATVAAGEDTSFEPPSDPITLDHRKNTYLMSAAMMRVMTTRPRR